MVFRVFVRWSTAESHRRNPQFANRVRPQYDGDAALYLSNTRLDVVTFVHSNRPGDGGRRFSDSLHRFFFGGARACSRLCRAKCRHLRFSRIIRTVHWLGIGFDRVALLGSLCIEHRFDIDKSRYIGFHPKNPNNRFDVVTLMIVAVSPTIRPKIDMRPA